MLRKGTVSYDKALRVESISSRLSPLQVIRSIHTLRRARSVLHLSQSALGKEIGRILKSLPVEQGTIAAWESGDKPIDDVYITAVGRLLATWLSQQMGRDDLGLKLQHNSPWLITPMAVCRWHKTPLWYRLHSKNQYDCGKHK